MHRHKLFQTNQTKSNRLRIEGEAFLVNCGQTTNDDISST